MSIGEWIKITGERFFKAIFKHHPIKQGEDNSVRQQVALHMANNIPITDSPDAPALRPDGTLRDASEMVWFHSPSDNHPMNFVGNIVSKQRYFS